MGKLNGSGQVVVDLYAGIGYYTLPLLVNAKVQKVGCTLSDPFYAWHTKKQLTFLATWMVPASVFTGVLASGVLASFIHTAVNDASAMRTCAALNRSVLASIHPPRSESCEPHVHKCCTES